MILFYKRQKKMNKASAEAGRPIFKEVTHIKKIVPGQNGHVIDREIRESDKEEFPVEWARWEQTQQNTVPGIPIDHWFAISETQKAEFKAMNIQTVEQFAGLSDANGQKIQGFNELRRKAQAFVEGQKDAELIAKVKMDAQTREAALQAQIDELRALVEAKTDPKTKSA